MIPMIHQRYSDINIHGSKPLQMVEIFVVSYNNKALRSQLDLHLKALHSLILSNLAYQTSTTYFLAWELVF